MAKILCVLYDDPVGGYPPTYARDDIPTIERYHDGQTTPTPEGIDFTPGELLGSVSGELGLRKFLEGRGHELIVTSDKDGPDSVFERELPDADVVISQPFWPAYLTAERIAKAPKLKLAHHRWDRLGPRGPAGGDRARHHGRRGHLQQQHQRGGARGDDDPGARAQLHSLLPVGRRRADGTSPTASQRSYDLEGMKVGIGRRRTHRLGGPAAPEAIRRRACTTPTAPASRRGREGARPDLSPERRVAGAASAMSSRSTPRCTPKPSSCSTTS